MNTSDILEVAISAAMAAGGQLIECYDDQFKAGTKESLRDVYSAADELAEEQALNVIRKFDPTGSILSEEAGFSGPNSGENYWVVDALDGSVNYLQHIPFFSVSIAYISDGNPVVGVVYAPLVDDLYYAAQGLGAFKNQRKICVIDKDPSESLFAASFSGKNYDPQRRAEEFVTFGEINDQTRGCLRTGSAALNLAYVAEGRLNGCWGKANKVWDIAAGIVIASEAKALVRMTESKTSIDKRHYIAAPPKNFDFLQLKLTRLFTEA